MRRVDGFGQRIGAGPRRTPLIVGHCNEEIRSSHFIFKHMLINYLKYIWYFSNLVRVISEVDFGYIYCNLLDNYFQTCFISLHPCLRS